MPRVPLTELEATVLGELSIQQPCTAYAIRRAFAQSPTPTWSGSAGTIYPVLERLLRRKLVRARAGHQGRRPHRILSLTPAGLARLRTWMLEPFGAEVAGPPMDPLRVRIGFLAALPAARRNGFLRRARTALGKELRRAELSVSAEDNPWEALITRSLILTQRSRLALVDDALRFPRNGPGAARPREDRSAIRRRARAGARRTR